METILNLGLNDVTVEGLTRQSRNPKFAWDSYRRFVQMYGDVVMGLKSVSKEEDDPFEVIIEMMKDKKGVKLDIELDTDDLNELVTRFKALIRARVGRDFPVDPWEQLWGAVFAVFESWNNDRARVYRELNNIPQSWGTAVNVQAMVFGNLGDTSATGVAFTRDAGTGEDLFDGEFLVNAQGEDVVAGIRTPQQVSLIGSRLWAQLAPRILNLDVGGARMWQIGAEGGLWDQPVPVAQLVLAPAERADVLVDFSALASRTTHITNSKPPSPVTAPAPPLSAVMQIRVGKTVSQPGPTAIPATLPGRAANLSNPATTRYITLNEIDVDEPTWFLNLNGVHFEEGPVTEAPRVGTVEDWVYINMTGDTHPMHTHLVTFQVVGRTPFDVDAYEEAYEGPRGVPGGFDPTPFATGPMEPPAPEERGFKDTVKVNPGYFTTIRAKFDLPAGVTAPQTYVHHCHIVEHEDNDMMRPFEVVP